MTQSKYTFKIISSFILIFTTLLFISCTDDPEVNPDNLVSDDSNANTLSDSTETNTDSLSLGNSNENTLGTFSSGVFVINEGNFLSDDGSISFIDSEGVVQNNIFSENNASLPLGDVVQSMYVNDTTAFILVNNSNKVEVVNVNEMKLLHTISVVSLPRYMISDGDYGYISEWVSFSDPGRISILDLHTYEILDTINVGFGAEALAIRNNKLYVSNNFENTLSVINLSTREIIQTISVGPSPSAMVIDKNDDLWIICSGGYNADYSLANNGLLVQLDANDKVLKEISLEMNVGGKLVTNVDSSILYFYSGTTVYSYALGDESHNTFIENTSAISFYGMGVSPDGDIYIADSRSFQSLGSVYIYDHTGQEQAVFEVGRGPNGFVFTSD